MKNISTLIVTWLLFSTASATDNIYTKVKYTGVNSNNIVFVEFEDVIPEPDCSKTQLWITPDTVEKDRVLSTALSAFHSGSKVGIKTNGCYKGQPTFIPNESDWGWIYIAK